MPLLAAMRCCGLCHILSHIWFSAVATRHVADGGGPCMCVCVRVCVYVRWGRGMLLAWPVASSYLPYSVLGSACRVAPCV